MKLYGSISFLVVGSATAFSPVAKPAFVSTTLQSSPSDYASQLSQAVPRPPASRNQQDLERQGNEAARRPPPPGMGDSPNIKIQGASLKTWALRSTAIERVEVNLSTGGRPLDADIDLWHGPDNTPTKMRVYVEDGAKRPFRCSVETPRGPNTIAIRNIGQMEFPIDASVLPNPNDSAYSTQMRGPPLTVQGGALKTFPFEPNVDSVEIMIQTDGRPLNARIELLQGPNNVKQQIEVYQEDGSDRPFYMIVETPGSGNVIRIVNTSTVEFPMAAMVEPYSIGNYGPGQGMDDIIVSGGDGGPDGFRPQF